LVFGGGSLFTDIESVRACFLWGLHALAAWLFRKPFFLAFQGIGPFRTRLGERISRWVVRRAAFVSVRDRSSFERVRTWKSNHKCVLSFDPVFLLFLDKKQHRSSQNMFIVIPRPGMGDSFRERALWIMKDRPFSGVRILSLHPDDPGERQVCRELCAALGGTAVVIPVRALPALLEHISSASFVLSCRFHGALAAIALGREMEICRQRDGDKLSSLVEMKQGDPHHLQERVHRGETALQSSLFS
jgi:polysaccharide pyruvyl transferase WcaK-like protein